MKKKRNLILFSFVSLFFMSDINVFALENTNDVYTYEDFLDSLGTGFRLFLDNITLFLNDLIHNYIIMTFLGIGLFISVCYLGLDLIKKYRKKFNLEVFNYYDEEDRLEEIRSQFEGDDIDKLISKGKLNADKVYKNSRRMTFMKRGSDAIPVFYVSNPPTPDWLDKKITGTKASAKEQQEMKEAMGQTEKKTKKKEEDLSDTSEAVNMGSSDVNNSEIPIEKGYVD